MIHIVDKPKGWTSFDVVNFVSRRLKVKAGHTGTLDPNATGVLVICTDADTKQVQYLTGKDKVYEAVIRFGARSDTWDSDYYEHYEEICVSPMSRSELENDLYFLTGNPTLQLPSFSAKKIKGKKMYDLARKGVVEERFQEMTIYSLEIISYTFPFLTLRCHVGSGTYIRSIAHYFSEKYGAALLQELRRTAVGDFTLADCTLSIEELRQTS